VAALGEAEDARTGVVKVFALVGYGIRRVLACSGAQARVSAEFRVSHREDRDADAPAGQCHVCLRRHLAPYSIRVNTVHPVGVNTPMIVNDAMAEFLAWILSGIIANS